jgi:site-specific recombinase XerD
MDTNEAITAFLRSCQARGLSPRTLDWYRSILHRFAVHVPEVPSLTDAVERFLAAVPGCDRTRYDYWKVACIFCRWCTKRYGVANPMGDIPAPKVRKKLPRTLSVQQLGCLFLVARGKRDRALLTLLVDTGIRVGEALNLAREDIGDETIYVDGKTGPREVPISAGTRAFLLELVSQGPLFWGYKGRMTRSGAYSVIREIFKGAGITGRKLGPHTLRHTFGRQYIVNGGDLVSLQRILGHTDIQTTRIYAELDMRDVVRQHHKFSPLRDAMAPVQGDMFDEVARAVDRRQVSEQNTE